MRTMPILETARLRIRPMVLDDLDAVHQLYLDIGWVDEDATPAQQLEARREYVQWSALKHLALARLDQPPYGDRAVVHRESGRLIGICGLVPYVGALGCFPYFGGIEGSLATAELGFMWAVSPAQRRQGYATETGRALADYVFTDLRLKYVIATTDDDNPASQAVMRKLGMCIEHNPYPDPPWQRVLGVLENDRLATPSGSGVAIVA